jgi:anti-sigma factor RsiW
MSCQEMHELLDGYVDSELDVVTTLQFERHLSECASCHARYQQYEQLTRTVKIQLPRFDAPAGLEAKIRAELGLAASTHTRNTTNAFADWSRWAVAASLIGVLVLTGTLFTLLNRKSPERCSFHRSTYRETMVQRKTRFCAGCRRPFS